MIEIIKMINLPTLNEILGIEDGVRFKFLYRDRTDGYKDNILETCVYVIKNNKLLYAEDIPYSLSNFSINNLYDKELMGIKTID